MKQRQTTHSWGPPDGRTTPRVQVLIESADPALAVSDFGAFTAAGIDVALCQGPGETHGECALLRGEPCDLAAGADVVLSDLGAAGAGVPEAHLRTHPAAPVVLRVGPHDGVVPQGCHTLPATASVDGQIDVLRRVALDARQGRRTST
jgi:hypothetical protein